MIAIKLSDNNFEYDIYSLVKAFYPKEDINFVEDCHRNNVSYFLVINYNEKIELRLYGKQPERQDISLQADSQLRLIYQDNIEADYNNRPDTKNRLKQLIYNCLSKETGKGLPWGTLNGIRPVKIPRKMLEKGKDTEEIKTYMKSTYLASDDKIDLSIDIAKREIELMRGVNTDTDYSLYIGIPFCPTTCAYCSFTSYPYALWKDRANDYLNALKREMEFTRNALKDKALTTIYIGGGTPTSLDDEYLDRLLSMTDEYFPVDTVREYNIEAGRPDSITKSKLDIIRSHGISRISVNPQSMNDKTLKLIGRHHSSQDVIDSFKLARAAGFDNINMDIIVGLPDEDINDLVHTLDVINDLKPDSLTVHSLAIKRSARLNTDSEEYEDYIINNSAEHMNKATACAESLNMKPYYLYRQKNMAGNLENIGFAASGKEGLYNILIMEEKQTIIALGAGADSKYVVADDSGYALTTGRNVTRSENVKDPGLYIDRIDDMIGRKKEKLEEIGWLIH